MNCLHTTQTECLTNDRITWHSWSLLCNRTVDDDNSDDNNDDNNNYDNNKDDNNHTL